MTATPTGLHFALQVGAGANLQAVHHAQMDLDGRWVLPPWAMLPSQGGGRLQPLPDGRVLVVGSGYWDHTIYAALFGCP